MAPTGTRAQKAEKVYRIGWLTSTGGLRPRPNFQEALRNLGWLEGKNFVFVVRSAEGERSRLQALALELVEADVDLVVAVAPSSIQAAKQATARIPIVMAWWGGPDLVESGIVRSLSRPGGNITGVHMLLTQLDAKRLDLLHQAVPKAKRIAVLIHDQKAFEPQLPPVFDVARRAGLDLLIVNTQDGGRGYEGAAEKIARVGAEAMLVMSSPDFARDREIIVELAARLRIPAIHPERVREGGLIVYGVITEELDRRAAAYVDKILRGANPGDLPIEQPTRFRLVVNLKVAKSLGITLPRSLLLQADETIE